MKFAHDAQFDAPVEDVFAVITDPRFQESKAASTTSEGSSRASVSRDGEGAVVTVERTWPTDGIQAAFRRVLGDEVTVAEKQTWGGPDASGARQATIEASIDGVPVSLTGTIIVSPAGSGCNYAVAADVTSRIPLLGRKVEEAAMEAIGHAARTETDLIAARLT